MRETGRGVVLPDAEGVLALFRDGGARALVARSGAARALGSLEQCGTSATLNLRGPLALRR